MQSDSAPMALRPAAAARALGVTPRTLFTWRRCGLGPPYVRVAGVILYPTDGLRRWLNDNAECAPAAAPAAKEGVRNEPR